MIGKKRERNLNTQKKEKEKDINKIKQNHNIKAEEKSENLNLDISFLSVDKQNYIEKESKNIFSEDNSKLSFSKIKKDLKKIKNNYLENNISIINNIDRLTSVLSSIIIAQNEKNISENNDSEDRIFRNNDDDDSLKIESISPEIIDVNKDKYLNYLLSLNDSLKKKVNKDINFEKINQLFTDFTFQNFDIFLKKIKK
jgi:hypothetical protein